MRLMSEKKKMKEVVIHKGILKYVTKELWIPIEKDVENNED